MQLAHTGQDQAWTWPGPGLDRAWRGKGLSVSFGFLFIPFQETSSSLLAGVERLKVWAASRSWSVLWDSWRRRWWSAELFSASSSCQRGAQRISWTALSLLLTGWTFALVTLALAGTRRISWLDFLYYCSYIKLAVTLVKYVPQVRSHTHTHTHLTCLCRVTSSVISLSSSWVGVRGRHLSSGH